MVYVPYTFSVYDIYSKMKKCFFFVLFYLIWFDFLSLHPTFIAWFQSHNIWLLFVVSRCWNAFNVSRSKISSVWNGKIASSSIFFYGHDNINLWAKNCTKRNLFDSKIAGKQAAALQIPHLRNRIVTEELKASALQKRNNKQRGRIDIYV